MLRNLLEIINNALEEPLKELLTYSAHTRTIHRK